jgi:lipopolysaccharide transport system permease protein
VLASINPVRPYPATPLALFASFWKNRGLILQLTRREVLSRYRGSIMGLAWSFFNPLVMLAVYTFVFSVVMKARWGLGAQESNADFAIVLFVGLIIHGLFAECLNRAPGLILSNVNYVKKVVFPLEILSWVAMGSALFHAGISLLVLVVVQLILNHTLVWTILFLPIVFIPLVLGTMGFTWIFASLGVYVRDVGHTVAIFTMVLLFLSPVFYPVAALPQEYRFLLMLNPLTFIIEQGRQVVIWGEPPDWPGWALDAGLALVFAWLGFWWFQKTRRGFADVV